MATPAPRAGQQEQEPPPAETALPSLPAALLSQIARRCGPAEREALALACRALRAAFFDSLAAATVSARDARAPGAALERLRRAAPRLALLRVRGGGALRGPRALRPLAVLARPPALEVAGCPMPGAAPLASLTYLRSLAVHDCGLRDAAPLAALTALTRLDLARNDACAGLGALAALTALRELGLGGIHLPDHRPAFAEVMGELAARLTALTSLDLGETCCSWAAVEAASALPRLRALDISRGRCHEGGRSMPSAFSRMTALTRLAAAGCLGEGDARGDALAAALAPLTRLADLDVSGCGVGPAGAARSLARLTQVTRLDVSRNPLGAAAAAALLRALPRLVDAGAELIYRGPEAAYNSLAVAEAAEAEFLSAAARLTRLESLRVCGAWMGRRGAGGSPAPLVLRAGLPRLRELGARDLVLGAGDAAAAAPFLSGLTSLFVCFDVWQGQDDPQDDTGFIESLRAPAAEGPGAGMAAAGGGGGGGGGAAGGPRGALRSLRVDAARGAAGPLLRALPAGLLELELESCVAWDEAARALAASPCAASLTRLVLSGYEYYIFTDAPVPPEGSVHSMLYWNLPFWDLGQEMRELDASAAEALAAAMPRLRHLSLTRFGVTDAGAAALCARLTALTELVLSGNPAGGGAAAAAAAAVARAGSRLSAVRVEGVVSKEDYGDRVVGRAARAAVYEAARARRRDLSNFRLVIW